MRGAKTVMLLFAIGILLFGCTSPPTPPSGGQKNITAPAGGGGTEGGAAGPGEGGGNGQPGTGNGEAGAGGPAGGNGGQVGGGAAGDYAGKDYATLAALGVPLQCDITITYQGKTTTAKLYMKGSEEIREEVSTTDSVDCAKTIVILKDKKMYLGCEEGDLFGTCKWMEFNLTEGETQPSGGAAGTYESPDLTDVPATQISCLPWIYDASKFIPSGKVCTMEDLLGGYPGGYPNNND
jgi:hypothetical protein